MSDIVERLRRGPEGGGWSCDFAAEGALIDEAADEIERLREPSWARLMEILDAHYPADVFDGSSGDPGPTIIVLIREIERLRDENERALRIGRLVMQHSKAETAEENLRALKIGRAVLASEAIPSMDRFAEAYRLGWKWQAR